MSIHVMFVGRMDVDEDETRLVLKAAPDEPERGFFVVSCRSPDEVVPRARDIARKGMIDVLDFVDHGDDGRFRMGINMLFNDSGTGRQIARALRPLLTPNARVRLLGCETALGESGQRLLMMLQREFGDGVAVYGTLCRITHQQFGPHGFQKRYEERFLFSATEAATRLAPTFEERADEVVEWYRSATLGDVTPSRSGSQS